MQKKTISLIYIVTLLLCSCFYPIASAGMLQLPVYHQERDISKYLYQENLPAMSEFTICFWLSAGKYSYYNDIISISVEDEPDELLLGYVPDDPNIKMYLYMRDTYVYFHNVLQVNYQKMFMGWHKHCFTWTVSGNILWYTDVEVSGQLQLYASASSSDNAIKEGGALIMLHDQDEYFGGLDENQVITGKIAWLNFWDHEMSAKEVKALGCRDKGNIVNVYTVHQEGGDMVHYETFPCKDTELAPFKKAFQPARQQMLFCKIAGHRLVNHMQSTTTASSAAKCVNLCVRDEQCYSVNYQKSTGVCELNDVTDLDNGEDLVTGENDYLYFTSRECLNKKVIF